MEQNQKKVSLEELIRIRNNIGRANMLLLLLLFFSMLLSYYYAWKVNLIFLVCVFSSLLSHRLLCRLLAMYGEMDQRIQALKEEENANS